MILALHGLTTMHSNCLTDVRIARDLGYGGIEFVVSKLIRYLDNGGSLDTLAEACRQAGTPAVCFNALLNADRTEAEAQRQLFQECERLCEAAAALSCPTIQLVFFSALEGRTWPEMRTLIARNTATLADIGRAHGVRFQLEPIAWGALHSLSQSLEVMAEAGRDNVGMVIDFWHLWAGGATTPDEVARLHRDQIYGVHICDGKRHVPGTAWDEGNLRGYLVGEGDIPLREWVAAVQATGFDGVWSAETYSPRHWEYDVYVLAADCRDRVLAALQPGESR
jgi:sugar phosphate isomerase/epimerase